MARQRLNAARTYDIYPEINRKLIIDVEESQIGQNNAQDETMKFRVNKRIYLY